MCRDKQINMQKRMESPKHKLMISVMDQQIIKSADKNLQRYNVD